MPLHPDVDRFIRRAIARGRAPTRVLELGSFAMHDHDPRPLFPGAGYVGIDVRPGPGVDVVGLAHEAIPELEGSFDAVLSLQALEHDPEWEATLAAGVSTLRRGGLVIVTCAGPGWVPHEYGATPLPGYYRNVAAGEILAALVAAGLEHGLEVLEAVACYPDEPLKRSAVWVRFIPHRREDGALRADVWAKLRGIQSAVTRPQCEALHFLAVAQPGPVVELGSYLGRSTCALALGLRNAGRLDDHVTAIDPYAVWTGPGGTTFGPDLLPRFWNNVRHLGLRPYVHHRQERSQEAAWDGPPVGLLFVDGDHTPEGVMGDWTTWEPRMARDGVAALHDVGAENMEGPAQVVAQAIRQGWTVVGNVGSLVVLARRDHPRAGLLAQGLLAHSQG